MADFDGSAGSPFVNQILRDRYQIQALLGRKPGRQTFLALDLQNQLPVVIKLLLFSPDFTWEDLKLFEREAETLKALDHPAIPEYLDFFEVEIEFGKGFALVQSYIEARSLQQLTEDGCRFSEAELMAIAKALLDILEYLYRLQPPVIHRDIKPSNILLKNRSGNGPGEVYLIDFGSVQTAAHGSTVTVVGTYGYMPPEQFGGRSLPASDLYGVGMVLIYLATGQHPADLPQNNLRIEFKHLTSLSESFTSWIEWLTDPSLTERPATAQDARLHFLKPRQEPEAALTREKTKLKTATRPSSSSISVKATQTTLELNIPSKQIQYNLPLLTAGGIPMDDETAPWIYVVLAVLLLLAYLALVSMPFFSIAFNKFWVTLLFLVLGLLVGSRITFFTLKPRLLIPGQSEALGQHFAGARSLPYNSTSANLTFRKRGNQEREVIVTLTLLKGMGSKAIFAGKLVGISAGAHTLARYRLSLKFRSNNQIIVVDGDSQEIEWLYNGLSKWAGIQVKPWK